MFWTEKVTESGRLWVLPNTPTHPRVPSPLPLVVDPDSTRSLPFCRVHSVSRPWSLYPSCPTSVLLYNSKTSHLFYPSRVPPGSKRPSKSKKLEFSPMGGPPPRVLSTPSVLPWVTEYSLTWTGCREDSTRGTEGLGDWSTRTGSGPELRWTHDRIVVGGGRSVRRVWSRWE